MPHMSWAIDSDHTNNAAESANTTESTLDDNYAFASNATVNLNGLTLLDKAADDLEKGLSDHVADVISEEDRKFRDSWNTATLFQNKE